MTTIREALDSAPKKGDKKTYRKFDGDRQGRYVKLDTEGNPKIKSEYQKATQKESEAAPSEAVQRYLIDKRPVNVHVIPALDCAPIFTREGGSIPSDLDYQVGAECSGPRARTGSGPVEMN